MRLKSKEKNNPRTSQQEITRILVKGALQCGLSVPATAKKLGVSKNLVYRVKRRGTTKRATGSGRPSKLTSSAKMTITKLNKEKLGSSVRMTAELGKMDWNMSCLQTKFHFTYSTLLTDIIYAFEQVILQKFRPLQQINVVLVT